MNTASPEDHLSPRRVNLFRMLAARLTHPLFILGLVITLSLLVNIWLLARPLYLPKQISQGRLDGRYIYWDKPYNQVRLLLAFVLLGSLYVWGWLAAKKAQGWPAWFLILAGALACAGVLLSMAPFDAADIYDNIMHARIAGVYGGNPFVQIGADFKDDPFYKYMAWKANPSAYGPMWELLAGGTARLAGDEIITNVLAFKLLPGIFWLASLGLIAGLFRYIAPKQALANTYLFALNPTVLYSTFGNGHNDTVMVFWIVLAAWAMTRRHYTLAVLALLAGAMVKFVPLLLIPTAGLIALVHIQSFRSRSRFMAMTVVASVGLIWLLYQPFWTGLKTLTIERRIYLFSSSIPASLYHALEPALGKEDAGVWIATIAAGITAFFALYRGWRARYDCGWDNFPKAAFDILAFYLLITCLWFQQWYTTWIIGTAAILPRGYRQRFAIYFSLAAMSKQLLVSPLLFRPKPIYPQPALEIIYTLGVLGLPWLYWLATYFTQSKTDA